MALTNDTALGLAMRFEVQVDGNDLGEWSNCKGLSIRFKHEKVKELGQHEYMTHIPGRAEYPKVTLQRAMKAGDWEKTRAWLHDVATAPWLIGEVGLTKGGNFTSSGGSGAKITLRDGHLEEVASWTLANALPIGWKGPSFDALGKKVALETLELVHEGFLDG